MDMHYKPGEYLNIVKQVPNLEWRHQKGDPKGVSEALLHKHNDGSYSHLLRVQKGVEFKEPVSHDFFEEAFYISGEMLNTKTREIFKGGIFVFHKPREKHGPLKCLKTCLILEFRYYK